MKSFDMTLLNDLDRIHLIMDTIDRHPKAGGKGAYLIEQPKKFIEHRLNINKHGQEIPEILNGKWKG